MQPFWSSLQFTNKSDSINKQNIECLISTQFSYLLQLLTILLFVITAHNSPICYNCPQFVHKESFSCPYMIQSALMCDYIIMLDYTRDC